MLDVLPPPTRDGSDPARLAESVTGAVCPPSTTLRRQQRRGIRWIAGSFVFCPCHLPVTLGLAAFLLGGTTLGALLRSYVWVAGGVITMVWAVGTWRGIVHLRQARHCATCGLTPLSDQAVP